jgi:CheY-like chemotaxis protein
MSGLLLVEDNDADVLFFKRALTRVRPDVPIQVAINGLAAVKALSEGPTPSLVILDLKLPKMSGLEVLEWMKSQPRLAGVRAVMLTSSSQESDIRRAYALGILAYVVKPIEAAPLRDVVAAMAACAAEPGEASLAILARHAVAMPAEI